MFSRRGTPATKAQVARFEAIHRTGCIACRKRGKVRPATIHHLTIGGRHGAPRRGHDFTIGLCDWHHLGCGPRVEMTEKLGPSYYHQARAFREEFGQDDELLAMQNDLIARLQEAA
jgi:hypothetical protein